MYANAIKKVLEQKNMSIDAFNGLSAHKKTTLLLQLTQEDRKQLLVQEQEALAELQKKRKEKLQLHKEQLTKRRAQTSLENIADTNNKKAKK